MNAADVLQRAADAGVTLLVEGRGRLGYRAPHGAVTPELRALIAAHRAELLLRLQAPEQDEPPVPPPPALPPLLPLPQPTPARVPALPYATVPLESSAQQADPRAEVRIAAQAANRRLDALVPEGVTSPWAEVSARWPALAAEIDRAEAAVSEAAGTYQRGRSHPAGFYRALQRYEATWSEALRLMATHAGQEQQTGAGQ